MMNSKNIATHDHELVQKLIFSNFYNATGYTVHTNTGQLRRPVGLVTGVRDH